MEATERRVLTEYQSDPLRFGEEVLGETYTDDVKALMLSVRDNVATIAKSANGTGKTHVAARLALWFFLSHPDSQVFTLAAPPEDNLRMLLWGELGKLITDRRDILEDFKISLPGLNVMRHSKSFIRGITIPAQGTPAEREARVSGKHAPYMLFIVDEGDAVPDEIYKGIESCMSGGHVRLLICFNPRHEAGPVYHKERDELANVIQLPAFNHPNVITGDDIYPGAVSRKVTVQRIHKWTRPLAANEKPDVECFELPSFLVGATAEAEKGGMLPPLKAGWYRVEHYEFWYKVLAEYPAQSEQQLISNAWVAAARARYDVYVAEYGMVPPKGVRPLMGLDVADLGKDFNACCLRFGGLVFPIMRWQGVDPDLTGERAARFYQENDVEDAFIDATGVGAGVAPKMQRKGCTNAWRVMVGSAAPETELGLFEQLRDYLYWCLREWLRTDPGAMLPPDDRLIEQLRLPKYHETIRRRIKVSSKDDMKALYSGESPDEMESLLLTFADSGNNASFAVGGSGRNDAPKSKGDVTRLLQRIKK